MPFSLPAEAVVIGVIVVVAVLAGAWFWERWRRGGRGQNQNGDAPP